MFLEHLWKGKEESEGEKKTGHSCNFILPTLEIVLEQQKTITAYRSRHLNQGASFLKNLGRSFKRILQNGEKRPHFG